jgi:hypothetical protein
MSKMAVVIIRFWNIIPVNQNMAIRQVTENMNKIADTLQFKFHIF